MKELSANIGAAGIRRLACRARYDSMTAGVPIPTFR